MNVIKCSAGALLVGVAMTVVPMVVTGFIASSRAILIDLVANVVIRALTCNTMRLNFYGLSPIEVPILWKFSKISAKIGLKISGASLLIALMYVLYQRVICGKKDALLLAHLKKELL